jgi:hypothetical protein
MMDLDMVDIMLGLLGRNMFVECWGELQLVKDKDIGRVISMGWFVVE